MALKVQEGDTTMYHIASWLGQKLLIFKNRF